MIEPIMRETIQWSPTDDHYIRYDFAYIDPASKRAVQYTVEVMAVATDKIDERIVPIAKTQLLRILKQKCGVKRAIENQIKLEPPRGVPSRYV